MTEEETRRLLRIRDGLERRIDRLQAEIGDLRRAAAEIDRLLASSGFRQPTPETGGARERGAISVKAKDGTVLGTMQVDENEIVFTPRDGLEFTVSIPPFRSFLVDRVLANMRSADESRAARGEVSPEAVLSYEVSTDGDRLLSLAVRSYGGERRLREIQSSLRWTFDKMYEKIRQT